MLVEVVDIDFRMPAYDITEVLEMVIDHCSWSSLMSLGHTTRQVRVLVCQRFSGRVSAALSRFIPEGQKLGFWGLLETTHGGLTGGFVRSVMSASMPIHQYIQPMELTITLPRLGHMATLALWRTFVQHSGYVFKTYRNATYWEDEPTIRRSCILQCAANRNIVIRLVESKSESILPAILSGPQTASFNVMTYTKLYCFYPTLFARQENVLTKERFYGEELDTFSFGVTTYPYTSAMDIECGQVCPALWRNTRGLVGVGVYHWAGANRLAKEDKDGFEEFSYLWRLQGVEQAEPNIYYIARKEVVAGTTWTKDDGGVAYLCDSVGIHYQPVVILGQVDEKGACLDTHGNFDLAGSSSFADAKLTFSLCAPRNVPGIFQTDFVQAFDHLRIIESLAPVPAQAPKLFLSEDSDGGPAVHFCCPIFKTITKQEGADQANEHGLRNYLVSEEYQPYLKDLEGTHELAAPMVVYNADRTLLDRGTLATTLVGSNVEVNFSLRSSPTSDSGFPAKKVIEINVERSLIGCDRCYVKTWSPEPEDIAPPGVIAALATPEVQEYSPVIKVFCATELLMKIVELASWHAWMNLARSSTHLRVVIRDIVKRRVRIAIRRFLPAIEVDNFWLLLEATKAGMTGGVVRSIMSSSRELYQYVLPTHLDIVVPRGLDNRGLARWRRFLVSAGYLVAEVNDAHYWDFKYVVSGSCTLHAMQSRVIVRIIEVQADNVLPAVLTGSHTSSFNLLTAFGFYCFYPGLFLRDENVIAYDAQYGDPTGLFNFGLKTYQSTAGMSRACGQACPAVWRNTRSLDGIGVFHWGGYLLYRRVEDDLFEQRSYLWRLGGDDVNGHGIPNISLPNPSLTSFAEWHNFYQAKRDYIARKEVLGDTTWVHICEGCYVLSDSGGVTERTLTVVGTILRENAYLGPQGNFIPDGDPQRFARSERRFSLAIPHAFPVFFQEDFRKAYRHLQILQELASGDHSKVHQTFLTDEDNHGPLLHFRQAIFDKPIEVTKGQSDSESTTEDGDSEFDDVRTYPVDPEYVGELAKLHRTHVATVPFKAFYKGGTPCALAAYPFALPGQLAEVKFKLSSSSLTGFQAEVLTHKFERYRAAQQWSSHNNLAHPSRKGEDLSTFIFPLAFTIPFVILNFLKRPKGRQSVGRQTGFVEDEDGPLYTSIWLRVQIIRPLQVQGQPAYHMNNSATGHQSNLGLVVHSTDAEPWRRQFFWFIGRSDQDLSAEDRVRLLVRNEMWNVTSAIGPPSFWVVVSKFDHEHIPKPWVARSKDVLDKIVSGEP
ncbi:hypothetical protein GALMADRAFT_216144 [Galerina marginata CBS 339.88]|uniref:Uncharacterized protein n=1 Tax=Galerina marginata (strain CBS 339.88) TaxID=685588 RepID=A0A067SAU1_GALM3|nr:hypothetical protein GALMADRAFT_216144 [Galerina marginata CBS 339.88]